MKNETNQTAHSTYRCEYHIVFAPKYRRQTVYGRIYTHACECTTVFQYSAVCGISQE